WTGGCSPRWPNPMRSPRPPPRSSRRSCRALPPPFRSASSSSTPPRPAPRRRSWKPSPADSPPPPRTSPPASPPSAPRQHRRSATAEHRSLPEHQTDWNTMTSLDHDVSTPADAPKSDVPVVTKADLRRAAWGASAGSALEYYDFALYSLASALVFGPLFF